MFMYLFDLIDVLLLFDLVVERDEIRAEIHK